MITIEKINEQKEAFIGAMKQNFINDGKLHPIVIILDSKLKPHIVSTPYKTKLEHKVMMEAMRGFCKKLNAVAIMIINEAYTLDIPKENQDEFMNEYKKSGLELENHPNRKEIATMIFETKLSHEAIVFEVDRTNNPKGELVNEKRKGQIVGSNFRDILSTPINNN